MKSVSKEKKNIIAHNGNLTNTPSDFEKMIVGRVKGRQTKKLSEEIVRVKKKYKKI